ncbi:ankyrin repeat domain-containing protein [Oryzihumus sp.]|uniref:ankyrin repeat domain-containing protein n=1 Tax=Oryzihumus sp. TaxID=1968903 RepID=UPI002ED9BF3B
MPGKAHLRLGDLIHAALACDVCAVRRLLDDGLDPGIANAQGFTALHFAAQARCAAVISLLLHAGAHVDPRDDWGNTPLSWAVFHARGEIAAVAVLLAAGADPDAPNHVGVTPRELAERLGADKLTALFAQGTARG